ncbi:MAG TPA: hypothetical protein VGA13_05880, partial [Acidimicrobiales bacterium]
MHTAIRSASAVFAATALSVGAAWAGVVVGPALVDHRSTAPELPGPTPAVAAADVLDAAGLGDGAGARTSLAPGDTELDAGEIADAAGADVSVPGGDVVPAGTFLVGAATATLAPAPEVF